MTRQVRAAAKLHDAIVVYPQTTYMYAYYSDDLIGIREDRFSMTGFTPVVADPRVVMLPGFEMGAPGPVRESGVRRSVELLESALAGKPPEVWVVRSRLYPDAVLPSLDIELRKSGYATKGTLEANNAEATCWSSNSQQSRARQTRNQY